MNQVPALIDLTSWLGFQSSTLHFFNLLKYCCRRNCRKNTALLIFFDSHLPSEVPSHKEALIPWPNSQDSHDLVLKSLLPYVPHIIYWSAKKTVLWSTYTQHFHTSGPSSHFLSFSCNEMPYIWLYLPIPIYSWLILLALDRPALWMSSCFEYQYFSLKLY